MRWALGTGAVVTIAVFVIGWDWTLSNADFIYMCCSARLLADGGWPVSAYFPIGYPLLLWPLIQAGLSVLKAGALLSAVGTGLSAAAVSWTARRLKLPVAIAIALGLLGATLPDVFEIAFNPHLDALYTGLGLWMIAVALAILAGDRRRRMLLAILSCAALLLILRYHAIIAAIPIGAVLVFTKPPARRAGIALLATVAIVTVLNFGALYAVTGRLETASAQQIGTGAAYINYGPETVEHIFTNYDSFIPQMPVSLTYMLSAGANNSRAVWPKFMMRKAVLAGLIFWLIAILLRRYPPGSHWLVLFILGYTFVVSATYFTPRASALPELVGILLAVLALARFIAPETQSPASANRATWRFGVAGIAAITLLLLGATGYNTWREARVVQTWRQRYDDVLAANRQALNLAGGRYEHLYGPMDYTAWPLSGRYNLPGSTYSRFWLDDPCVAHIAAPSIARYRTRTILSGDAPVSVILLWERHGRQPGHPLEIELIAELERSWLWNEVIADVDGTRLWMRGR